MKKILVTGATSFSGAWLIRELLKTNNEVVGFTRNRTKHNEAQKKRIDWILEEFPNFNLISSDTENLNQEFDVICLHGSATFDYRSPKFDLNEAVRQTNEINSRIINNNRSSFVFQTGSYWEEEEGLGTMPLRSFNKYSDSKKIIYDLLVEKVGYNRIHKYVIPNIYGPMEPSKFTQILIDAWAKYEVPIVNTPNYIRDFVPIDLLSKHYAKIINNYQNLKNEKSYPSKYVMSVGNFAQKYATAVGTVMGETLQVREEKQKEFSEPRMRVNVDYCEDLVIDWEEENSWAIVANDAIARINELRYKCESSKK